METGIRELHHTYTSNTPTPAPTQTHTYTQTTCAHLSCARQGVAGMPLAGVLPPLAPTLQTTPGQCCLGARKCQAGQQGWCRLGSRAPELLSHPETQQGHVLMIVKHIVYKQRVNTGRVTSRLTVFKLHSKQADKSANDVLKSRLCKAVAFRNSCSPLSSLPRSPVHYPRTGVVTGCPNKLYYFTLRLVLWPV